MVIDVQGFGFLQDCFPKANLFSGAGSPSNRGKTQFRSRKDEAGHVALEMMQSGLIHYEPRLKDMHYNHKNMKREGGTTILKHMLFEVVNSSSFTQSGIPFITLLVAPSFVT